MHTDISMQVRLTAVSFAPVLLKLKTANMLNLSKNKLQEFLYSIENTQIQVLKLCECKRNCLLLLYREELLKRHLEREDVIYIMEEYGYNRNLQMDEILLKLINRFRRYKQGEQEFPHEIGIFLEYPVEDMIGYIGNKGKNCIMEGYWKVYSNPVDAMTKFAIYDIAKAEVSALINKGYSLGEIVRGSQIA